MEGLMLKPMVRRSSLIVLSIGMPVSAFKDLIFPVRCLVAKATSKIFVYLGCFMQESSEAQEDLAL